jgi:hypothetical protein
MESIQLNSIRLVIFIDGEISGQIKGRRLDVLEFLSSSDFSLPQFVLHL